MRLKHFALGLAVVTAAPIAATAAQAADLYIPLFTYRTGPFAGSGIPIRQRHVRLLHHAQ